MAAGVLVVVGTPIGNLGDISPRAVEALEKAEVVACEDTRRCGQLYKLLALKAPKFVSYYKEVERGRVDFLLDEVRQGKRVVLVSDSGMPGISDPGAVVIAAARKAGLRVEMVPGATAVASAFAGCGFEGSFLFAGFLPRKGKERRGWFERHKDADYSVVLYESPFRVKDTVEDFLAAWGDREAYVVRELTKLHEEWIGGSLVEILDDLKKRKGVKGECVVVVRHA